MAVDKSEAIARIEAEINQPDLDWPTKHNQVVFDELTIEKPWGWVLFYGFPEELRVRGRDPEPEDNPPYVVNRKSGEIKLLEDLDAVGRYEASLS